MATLYPAETNNGVVTSWIPLTEFTPSAACSSQFRLNGPSLVKFDPGYGVDIDPKAECEPPAVTTWWEQRRLGEGSGPGHTAVSLGPMTCPTSWTTVASSVRGGSSTLAMCCPYGYFLANGIPGSVAGDCQSVVDSGMTLTFASTPATESTSWEIVTTTLADSSTVGAIAVVGWNIQQVTQATSSSSAPSSVASTSWRLEPLPTSSSSTTTAGGPRLSIKGVIGITSALTIAVMVLIALLAWLCWYCIKMRSFNASDHTRLQKAQEVPELELGSAQRESSGNGERSAAELDGGRV